MYNLCVKCNESGNKKVVIKGLTLLYVTQPWWVLWWCVNECGMQIFPIKSPKLAMKHFHTTAEWLSSFWIFQNKKTNSTIRVFTLILCKSILNFYLWSEDILLLSFSLPRFAVGSITVQLFCLTLARSANSSSFTLKRRSSFVGSVDVCMCVSLLSAVSQWVLYIFWWSISFSLVLLFDSLLCLRLSNILEQRPFLWASHWTGKRGRTCGSAWKYGVISVGR